MFIHAKKSLGQNFLKSKAAVREILESADLSKDDIILEVGPGKGVLTESLLQSGARVLAIEKDGRLIEFLNEKFLSEIKSGQLVLINGDILDFESDKYKINNEKLLLKPYKLIANIPYYITGALIRKFLESNNQPTQMVLMLQKEVAKRIVASDRKESLLSISVKVYGKPKYVATVPARYFAPAPKVDSAILQISDITKKFFTENNISEEKFFELLHAGFAHKRKMVIRNLEAVCPKDQLSKIFSDLKISPKSRGEDLSLETWKLILTNLH